MAGRLLFPEQRALDADGAPINGAKCYTFVTGTSTNLATYTTSALSVAHTNPVLSDSEGHFPDLWAAPDVAFRLVVTAGTEASYAGATPLPEGTHDPVYAQGAGVNPTPRLLTTTTALSSADLNESLFVTGTWTMTLPLGSGLSAGWRVRVTNEGTGTVTLTTQGGDLIGSTATRAMGRTTAWDVEWDGTTWHASETSAGTGRHALWVPATAMLSRTTSGPTVSATETSTNKVNLRTLDFSNSANQYAQVQLAMPKSWDEGAVTFRPFWSHGSTTTNFTVSWNLQAVALRNAVAEDTAFGTQQTSSSTGGTTATVYRGPESAAITIAGTPQAEDLVVFQLYRETTGVTGNLAVVASLLGIVLYLNTDAGSDA